MHAIDRPFTQIINGSTQFVIPSFSIDYSWTDSPLNNSGKTCSASPQR